MIIIILSTAVDPIQIKKFPVRQLWRVMAIVDIRITTGIKIAIITETGLIFFGLDNMLVIPIVINLVITSRITGAYRTDKQISYFTEISS